MTIQTFHTMTSLWKLFLERKFKVGIWLRKKLARDSLFPNIVSA